MPFLEVVEGQEIHNFPISCLVHFCWRNLRKTLLNSAIPKRLAPERVGTWECATSHPATSASPPYATVRARRGRLATIGPSAVPRRACAWYLWAPKRRHALRPHAPTGGTAFRPLTRHAAPGLPLAAAHAPSLSPYRDHC
jgi:hypothetical protein